MALRPLTGILHIPPLLSARSTPGGATPEAILRVSSRPGIGSADERVRFCITFDPDGLFSRDTGNERSCQETLSGNVGRLFCRHFLHRLHLLEAIRVGLPSIRISYASDRNDCAEPDPR